FFPRSFDDVRTVTSTNGPENTSYRMVTGYWELACSFVAHGVLHADLFFESGGEALFVWAKLSPFIADLRRDQQNPRILANVEKAIATAPGVPVGPASERPVVLAVPFLDRKVVDAGQPQAHIAAFVKFPVLVSVGAEPASRV